MIDDAFLRQTAALQANLKMLESQQDALSDFQDMQALRLYKSRLADYIEAHVRAGNLPRDPFQAIEQRLIALSEFFTAADQECKRLNRWKADWLNSVPAVGLAEMQSARTELAERVAEVPQIQESLAQRLSPQDWDTSSAAVDLHAEMLACAQCVSGLKLPPKTDSRRSLSQFTRGEGAYAKETSAHFTAMGLRIEELIALHAGHVKALEYTDHHLSNDDLRSADKIFHNLGKDRFSDIDYVIAETRIADLAVLFKRFTSFNSTLDEQLEKGRFKIVKAQFDHLRSLIDKPDSELGQECLTIAEQIELKFPRFLPNMSQGFIRGVALHCSSLFSDSAKSEINRLERLAEANAKTEREVIAKLTAKLTAELTAEIGAGRTGASLSVSLFGKALMRFAFCPAGSFIMGSPEEEEGRHYAENQVHVTLSKGFWMAKTEVTHAQWQAVMGNNLSWFKGDDLPVARVSWHDAQKFIEKVNGNGVIPEGWKVALPTEAQWEYACRAGKTGGYSGGIIDQVAWYCRNSNRRTHSVGTKNANAWGLYDMHGNVFEWCADWYDVTLRGGTDPTGPSSGDGRVVRGGSWAYIAADCRAASRKRFLKDSRNNYVGFRPALVPSK